MAGRQAKVMTDGQVRRASRTCRLSRHPERDAVMLLLSVKAGLRAGEIANLTWPMVLDPCGRVAHCLELHDSAAKKGSGRTIPLHPELRMALRSLRAMERSTGAVVKSERGGGMRPSSIVGWFARLYAGLGFEGCSSHSGRRTFITKAARQVHRAGGSLRDVQQLAGHRSIDMTQRYIEGNTAAQRKIVALL